MSINLYVINTFPINITNLFLGTIFNSDKRVLGPCQFNIKENGILDVQIGKTVDALSSSPEYEFRNIEWHNKIKIKKMNVLCRDAEKQNKFLMLGSHHETQISYLKKYYREKCFTIGLFYNENLYDILLENMARYHIFLLKYKKIQINEHDAQNLKILNYKDLIAHYMHTFDQQKLISKCFNLKYKNYDYIINISDFFDKDKLLSHYNNIGFQDSAKSKEYYDHWYYSYYS